MEIVKTDSRYWRLFKQHYYLNLPLPVAPEFYVGAIDGELVAHVCVSPFFQCKAYRATRLVVMPEWQGAGVGTRFLDTVCQLMLDGEGRGGKKLPTLFHTSHPQLCAAFRRSKRWIQISAQIGTASNKGESRASVVKSGRGHDAGYGGHMRAVQGFKYIGAR